MVKPSPAFDENGLSTSAGWVQVHNVEPLSREFIGSTEEYLAPGVGLPVSAYLDATPSAQSDKAICRTKDGSGWEWVVDYRGMPIFSTITRQESVMSVIGEIPDGFTLLKPGSDFDTWNGSAWETDQTARQAYITLQNQTIQKAMLGQATEIIAPLQDAVDLGIATDVENEKLLDWKKYRIELTRVDTSGEQTAWPDKPTV